MLGLLCSFKECWTLFCVQLLTHEFDPFKVCFFFSKEFKCLLRVKYKHRPIDLQKNRVFGELFVPGLQLYAPVTIYWGAGSFTARIGDWKGHLMIVTGK